jgi:hypothetical protein
MTDNELLSAVLVHFPEAEVNLDLDGQIIIYTGIVIEGEDDEEEE